MDGVSCLDGVACLPALEDGVACLSALLDGVAWLPALPALHNSTAAPLGSASAAHYTHHNIWNEKLLNYLDIDTVMSLL